MKFSFEEEKNGKLPFLDIEVYREGKKFLPLLSFVNQLLVVSTRILIVFYILHINLA